MAKSVFDKINDYIAGLADNIEKGMTAVVIREVDRYALDFFRRVRQGAPYHRLKGNIELKRIFKRGKYGYTLVFDGYDGNNTPLQMIANVINTGRVAGEGVAESGRRYAYGSIEGIKFMTNNLELLSRINPSIMKAADLMKWVVTDDHIQLSDGTKLSTSELDSYIQKSNETGE